MEPGDAMQWCFPQWGDYIKQLPKDCPISIALVFVAQHWLMLRSNFAEQRWNPNATSFSYARHFIASTAANALQVLLWRFKLYPVPKQLPQSLQGLSLIS